jgi:hypothetical protein
MSPVKDRHGLLEFFERAFEEAQPQLSKTTEENLLPTPTIPNNDQKYEVSTKAEMITMTCCQIPGGYDSSGDETVEQVLK